MYPNNALMHQVSGFSGKLSAYDFTPTSTESLSEVRDALRHATMAVVDATEDPARAVAGFSLAIIELPSGCVAVYTETVHQGLELFVRARGVPLFLGPMSDAQWEGQFDVMRRSLGRKPRFGFLVPKRAESDAGQRMAWLRKHRLETSPYNRFRKTA